MRRFIIPLILLILSLDFWNWSGDIHLGVLHFPTWLFYFVVLQLALSLYMWWFCKVYWEKEDVSHE